jgi:hypothetical protein
MVLNQFKRTMPPILFSLAPTFRSNHDIASQPNLPNFQHFNRTSTDIAKSGVVSKVNLFQYFFQTKDQL